MNFQAANCQSKRSIEVKIIKLNQNDTLLNGELGSDLGFKARQLSIFFDVVNGIVFDAEK
ncbi:MAG: hypothetical protein ACXVBQ_11300 [Pseudobdellovibrionaceae bacterium]